MQSTIGRAVLGFIAAAISVLIVHQTIVYALGLYGIVRYTVAQRTREIGIRLALGATPGGVVRLALADAAWTLAPGATVGLAAAMPLAWTLRPLLHDVRPFDVSVLAVSFAATAAGALVAVWVPARTAARIEPAAALRTE